MDNALQASSLTRPASPAAIGAALKAAEDRIEQIPLANIHPSPTNPRKTFDGIEDLAASIAVQGLLQPIVVRPMKKDGAFEILAGERRFRALKHLKRETAPCKVMIADDGRARAVQLVENLQREDVGILEEAEGFKALQDLDPKTWTPQAIAKVIGKTDRFVQQRLAVARNLAPEARELLVKGEIKVETARVLASAPASTQRDLIKEGSQFGWQEIGEMSADEIRQEINSRAVPLDKAAFDVALYDGLYMEEGKTRRFADVEKFDELQEAAAKALLAKLRKDWPKASIVKAGALQNWAWADNKANLLYGPKRKGTKAEAPFKVAKDKVTAIVWIANDKSLHHAEGVAKAENFRSTTTSHSSGPTTPPETPEHAEARRKFSADVRTAVLKKPDLVRRLTVLALLQIEFDDLDEHVEDEVKRALPTSLKPFAFRWFNGDTSIKAMKAMEGLKPAALDQAIAALAVAQVGWGDWPRQMPADIKTIAGQVGVKFVAPKPEPEQKPDAGPADKEAKLGKAKAKAKSPAAKKKAAKSRKHQ